MADLKDERRLFRKSKPPKKERPKVIDEETGEVLVPWGGIEDKLKELCLV